MIRKLSLLLFTWGIITSSVAGQDSLAYKSKWQTKLLSGTNIPITKLLQGAETDCFFQYDDHSFYWQILSISYFFHKHWGVEFNYQAGTSGRIRKRADNFDAEMQSEYGNKYYVYPRTGASVDDFNVFLGDIERGYLGIIYRFETNKFYVYPKFSIGMLSFSTDWGNVHLKEKNSNNTYEISYSSGKRPNDHFTLATSASFGYKLSKRFYLNADIMFSYYKTNIVFEKELVNWYTKESIVERFDYKRSIFTLSLGAGVIFVIH